MFGIDREVKMKRNEPCDIFQLVCWLFSYPYPPFQLFTSLSKFYGACIASLLIFRWHWSNWLATVWHFFVIFAWTIMRSWRCYTLVICICCYFSFSVWRRTANSFVKWMWHAFKTVIEMSHRKFFGDSNTNLVEWLGIKNLFNTRTGHFCCSLKCETVWGFDNFVLVSHLMDNKMFFRISNEMWMFRFNRLTEFCQRHNFLLSWIFFRAIHLCY